MSQVRFRVMKDCWYVLLRSYVRVDGVRVRILDTRMFHDFGSAKNGANPVILRQFTHQESTYELMKAKGFHPSSEWLLDPNQADICARFVDEQ